MESRTSKHARADTGRRASRQFGDVAREASPRAARTCRQGRVKTTTPLRDRVLELLRAPGARALDKIEISKALRWPSEKRAELRDVLGEMEAAGVIVRIRKDRYVLPQVADLVTGKLQVHAGGNAHLLSETPGVKDPFVSAPNLGTAMNGDKVVARLIHEGRQQRGDAREAEVIKTRTRERRCRRAAVIEEGFLCHPRRLAAPATVKLPVEPRGPIADPGETLVPRGRQGGGAARRMGIAPRQSEGDHQCSARGRAEIDMPRSSEIRLPRFPTRSSTGGAHPGDDRPGGNRAREDAAGNSSSPSIRRRQRLRRHVPSSAPHPAGGSASMSPTCRTTCGPATRSTGSAETRPLDLPRRPRNPDAPERLSNASARRRPSG